jgi:hypothetical protein
MLYRGRILGRIWDKSLQSFPPCYSQSPLSKSGLKMFCIVNIVYRNLKSENFQDLNEIAKLCVQDRWRAMRCLITYIVSFFL